MKIECQAEECLRDIIQYNKLVPNKKMAINYFTNYYETKPSG